VEPRARFVTCQCVCERERARARARASESERERERESARARDRARARARERERVTLLGTKLHKGGPGVERASELARARESERESLLGTKLHNGGSRGRASERASESESESERESLLGTKLHNGGSRGPGIARVGCDWTSVTGFLGPRGRGPLGPLHQQCTEETLRVQSNCRYRNYHYNFCFGAYFSPM